MADSEYVQRVASGKLTDPVVSFQAASCFEASGVIANYMHDPAVDSWKR